MERNKWKQFCFDYANGVSSAAIAMGTVYPYERLQFFKIIQYEKDMAMKDCLKKLLKDDGPIGLYRGYIRNTLKYGSMQAINFSLYELYLSLLTTQSGWTSNLFAGALSGATSLTWKYTSDVHIINQIKWQSKPFAERMRLYYKGFGISLTGFTIYRSVYFGVFDSLRQTLIGDIKSDIFGLFRLAFLTSALATIITRPIDAVRQVQLKTSKSEEPLKRGAECARIIYEADGISGFFKMQLLEIIRVGKAAIVLTAFHQLRPYF